ncbi:MAG: HD domain-containing protein [Bacteroidetes bacterium]|nr:HD domain-containing protein [Bacteroidota bacterium]
MSEVAERTGMPAWVVGGYVRDLLLKNPSKDIDMVVLGSGVDFARELAHVLPGEKHVSYFRNFGTAQIKTTDWVIECIGARKESYNRESRKPAVENGSLEDDQLRRDFTINSMYLSLNAQDFGELLDPFNGLQDLQDGIIRTPTDPDITFSDDPLRMMRAIRFATRLGFSIAADTWQAIEQNAERIRIVSQERITDELNGIIMCSKPSIGFRFLYDSKLLHIIFPELCELQGVETRNGKGHKDNFYHTLQVLDQICAMTDNLWLRWSAILHDIAKPATKRFDPVAGWTFHGHEDRGARMVKAIFRRMRLPLDEKMRYVEKMVMLHLRPIVLATDVTDSAVRRLIVDAGEDVLDLITLCRADITSKNEAKVKRHLQGLDRVLAKIQDVTEKDAMRNWQPVITGNHIMELFELPHPRYIGELKNAAREAILEGTVPNELEPALNWVKEKGLELGLTPKSVTR